MDDTLKGNLSVHFLNLKQVNLMRHQMQREHAQIMKITNVLSNFSLCSNQSIHRTEIDCLSFQQGIFFWMDLSIVGF
jgi:hypothetical protein